MYRVSLFKLLYNTCMQYLIQHLAYIRHIMIPWCVYLYCEVGKGNGFCRPTSDLICDNSGIETCVLCSSLCLQISCHRYVLVNQQADYTATPSFLVSSDQLYWSDNFIQSARRGLEKSRGTWSAKTSKLIVYHRVSLTTPIPCDLSLQGLCPIFNHQYAWPRHNT